MKMKVNRKKRVIIIFFAIILQTILSFFFILYSPSSQSFLARQLVKIFANYYDIDAKIDRLYFSFPNNIVLETIEVKDSLKENILTADKITAGINDFSIRGKLININELTISSPHINTYIDKNGKKNFDYIINKFSTNKDDTSKTEIRISCKKFILDDANFSFVNQQKEKKDSLFDINNINLLHFSTTISDIKYSVDSLSVFVEDFKCEENNSGFKIKDINTKISLSKNELLLSNLTLIINDSKLICPKFQIKKKDSKNFDWTKHISVKLNIDSLIFDVSELAFFSPKYKGIHEKIRLSGDFSGKYSNFKCDNFKLSCGIKTNLSADLSVNGLPDYDNTFIFGNVDNLNTTIFDIQNIIATLNPPDNKNNINKKNIVREYQKNKINFSNINFRGNITGLANDFVTYGIFTTNLGTIKTDAAFVSDFEKKSFKLKGNIVAKDVELGQIINDTSMLGKISLNATLNGKFSKKNVNFDFGNKNNNSLQNFIANYFYNINSDCNIENINVLDYTYQNISINGDLDNDLFEGKIKIDDENLRLLFDGKYYISSKNIEENELNCRSFVRANLSKLHLLPDSVNSKIIFALNSNIKGDFLKFPTGNLDIKKLKFTYNERLLEVPELNVNMFYENNEQKISVKSDLLELDANGIFKFNELKYYVQSMLNSNISAFIPEPEKPTTISNNNIDFNIAVNRLNDIIQMFVPNISIPEELLVDGRFSSKNNYLNTHVSVPLFMYDSIFFWGNEINLLCSNDSANVYFNNQEIGKPNAIMENLNIKSTVKNNRNTLNVKWNNNDTLNQNYGDLKVLTKFKKEDGKKIPTIDNILYKTDFMVNNKLWKLKKSNIYVDANEKFISISDFTLRHQYEEISLEGEISNKENNKLNININNFDLSFFNSFFDKNDFKISGYLDLYSGSVSDVFNSFKINLSPEFSDLKLYDNNPENLSDDTLSIDNIIVDLEWNSSTKEFLLNTESTAEFIKKIYIKYNPSSDKLSGEVKIKDFNVSILNPLLDKYGVCGLDNNVSINANIAGSLGSPLVDGNVIFTNTALTYRLLNLQVILNDTVKITNNSFLFERFAFEDKEKNKGRINGGLYHNNFKNFRFDFNVFCMNMKIMNTTEKDNNDYYGTVYGTGSVKIAGNAKNFGIDVNARTAPNSVFVLPMSSSYENSINDFVTFIKHDSTNFEMTYTPPESSSDYYLIINAEVTPDAIIQIDFDPKIGDIIRARAKGNIKVEYNPSDGFFIYGETEIQEGNYLFTLENIINKKFIIKKGGTLTWSGDPINANIDISASYRTRAPIKDLFFDSVDSTEFNQTANVDCNMHLSGLLTKPDIEFSIDIPNGNEKVKSQLSSLSQDDINKQFAFLLIMNRFYNQMQNDNPNIGNIASNTMSTTSFELISNQISNWLSQISNDLDIGIKYQPGTTITGQELELALSYQTKNERFLINGNVGYNDNRLSNTNTMVGDIEVQYKVTQNGNFRIKGFSRKNNEFETIYGPYTAGLGVFYTKDFNTFKEMIFDIWNSITFKKLRDKAKNEKNIVKSENNNNSNEVQKDTLKDKK